MLLGVFVCVAVILAVAGCSRQLPPGQHNNFHAYGVQHASLHLEYFGDTRGTEDFFEDSAGLREAHGVHSEFVTDEKFQPTSTYTVRIGSNITIVDSVRVVEVRLTDKTADSLFHLPADNVPTPEEQFKNFIGKRGFILRGDTSIQASGMSLKAHVYQSGEQPSYLFEYKGLILGSSNNNEGHITELRLMSIDTISPIDPARFVSPHGLPVMDMNKAVRNAPGSQP